MEHIGPNIINRSLENFEELMYILDNSLVNNSSPKAAVDMALYDLYGQLYNIPVYKLLGGFRNEITTDITISVNEPEEMVEDSLEAIEKGYETLKIKVGKDWRKGLRKAEGHTKTVGYDKQIRIDANQGWTPKEAVLVIRHMEDLDLDIELVEQPVKAKDLKRLKICKGQCKYPILAG